MTPAHLTLLDCKPNGEPNHTHVMVVEHSDIAALNERALAAEAKAEALFKQTCRLSSDVGALLGRLENLKRMAERVQAGETELAKLMAASVLVNALLGVTK